MSNQLASIVPPDSTPSGTTALTFTDGPIPSQSRKTAHTPEIRYNVGPNGKVRQSLTVKQHYRLAHAQEIKNRYKDGVPLAGEDARFIYAVLTNHPRAKAKIGCGVRAIVVHPYIGNTRAFFVIRTDGTVEDFSAAKVIRNQWPERTSFVASMMATFRTSGVFAMWRRMTSVKVAP